MLFAYNRALRPTSECERTHGPFKLSPLHAARAPNPYVTLSQLIIFTLFALFSAVFVLWRRARKAIAVAGVALFWLLASGWLAAPLLAAVQGGALPAPPPRFGASTVIVVLGDGTRFDARGALVPRRDAMPRIATAASLYAQCKQERERRCKVIMSGGNPEAHPAAEADTYAPYLLRAHVARDDLILENKSRTTYENAKDVARILRGERYDSLMLVTSAYHMPRALMDFHRFGLAPEPIASSGRVVRRGLLPRRSNLIAANVALHELIGIAQFHVYRALGWF
jgi:uncharacterized SAM-binding protein YcdF (DUF218 family)